MTPVIAAAWAVLARELTDDEARRVFGKAPRVGQIVRLPDLGQSLRLLADRGTLGALRRPALGRDLLRELARAHGSGRARARLGRAAADRPTAVPRCSSCRRTARARWRCRRSLSSSPLPPRDAVDRIHLQAEALKLAFADGYRQIADGAAARRVPRPRLPRRAAGADRSRSRGLAGRRRAAARRHRVPLLRRRRAPRVLADPERLHGLRQRRRGARARASRCRTAARASRSRPATRTASRPASARSTRSSPACSCATASLLGPFGVMGGHFQPQGHLQVVEHLLGDGPRPPGGARRAALPRRSRRAAPGRSRSSRRCGRSRTSSRRRGHRVLRDPDLGAFGGGQAILVQDDVLVGGSEPRKDGYAAGF